MPRTLAPRLRQCLERANPNVATFVEISAPDQAAVLRRAADQFLQSPPLVSMTPGLSAVASATGALTLASSASTLVNQFAEAGGFNIPQEDGGSSYVNTVAWDIDPGFGGCILRSVTVRLKWLLPIYLPDVKLVIFRAVQQAGVLTRKSGTSTVESDLTQVSFAQLLQEPIVLKAADLLAAGIIGAGGFATVTFDLRPYHIAIDPISAAPPGPGESGQLPAVYFSVQTLQQTAGNLVEWRYDTTSSRVLAGIGKVRELSWTRTNPENPNSVWVPSEAVNRALCIKIDVEQYVPTSAEVYALSLPALPDPASLGRIVFNRGVPRGTTATLELSTAGAGGPYTAVTHGDPVALHQVNYHARLTMNASADQRRAPIVSALGLEFRERVDVSPESIVEHMAQEVAVPFLAASVGEGAVTIVRAGRRDYHDVGSELAVRGADTQLEADIFLGSRHPMVTRDDWFLMARAVVSNRQPTGTSEHLSLLSIAKTLKRKIPEQVESISTQHTVVAGTTTTQVLVSPALDGATSSGNEYDAKGYYLRVQSSTQAGVESGRTFTILGNTGVDRLDFATMPGTLVAGDIVEVHSARYALPTLSWIDQDPADVWWELLTVYLQIPPERIGRADVGTSGRSGLPPRVTDRAPGDGATQAKLTVTNKLTSAESGDALIDELSFIMGGVTIEIAGQIVFRQIYPLRDAAGRITVPNEPTAFTFDSRDYASLETPTGREHRISVLTCDYGVDASAEIKAPVASAVSVDVDALDALGLQDVEGLGTAAVPSEIARWCYNSSDAGALLAGMLATQVVFAASTGLRVWPWVSVDAHPELTVGDTVVVVTDQYTDYDPAKRIPISGPRAYPLTIVSASEGGRRFRGFLQGLQGVTGVNLRGGDGGVLTDAPTVPLAIRLVRDIEIDITTGLPINNGRLIVRVYVADPAPTNGVPITVSTKANGVESVLPSTVTLLPPTDPITADLETTDYAEFIVTEPAAGSPDGLVSFTAKRAGRLPSTSTPFVVRARDKYGVPAPTIGPLTAEGTGAGGNLEGCIHVPIIFDADTAEVRIFSAEELFAGVATDVATSGTSGIVRRQEGIVESAEDWETMWDIGTTPSYYRKVVLVAVGPTGIQSDPLIVELQAIDTGTGPTGGPSAIAVVMSEFNGLARATVTITLVDVLAFTRIIRNGVIVAMLVPGDNVFVDDGLTPASVYRYEADHYRNGQTSGNPSSTPILTVTPTLVAPTWRGGYPYGSTVVGLDFDHSSDLHQINFVIDNPDPLARTIIMSNSSAVDGPAPFPTLIADLDPGVQYFVGDGPAGGVTHWFYAYATRDGYIDSVPSAHAVATWGG